MLPISDAANSRRAGAGVKKAGCLGELYDACVVIRSHSPPRLRTGGTVLLLVEFHGLSDLVLKVVSALSTFNAYS